MGAARFRSSPSDPHPDLFSGPDPLLPLPRLAGLHPRLPASLPCLGGTGIRSMSRQSFSPLHLFPPAMFRPHFSTSIRAASPLPSVFSHSFILDMIAFRFSKIAALAVSHQGQTHVHVGFKTKGNTFGWISLKENFNAFEIGEPRYLAANQTQTVKLGPQTVHKTSIRINSCCGSIFSACTAHAGVFKETEA